MLQNLPLLVERVSLCSLQIIALKLVRKFCYCYKICPCSCRVKYDCVKNKKLYSKFAKYFDIVISNCLDYDCILRKINYRFILDCVYIFTFLPSLSFTENLHTFPKFLGTTDLKLTASLSGGAKDVAWQHAQLFRQKLDNTDEFPLDIIVYLKKNWMNCGVVSWIVN